MKTRPATFATSFAQQRFLTPFVLALLFCAARPVSAQPPAVYVPFDGNVNNFGASSAAPAIQLGNSGSTSFVPGEMGVGGQALDISVTTSEMNGPRVAINSYSLPDSGTMTMRYYVEPYYNYQTVFDNSVDKDDWEAWIYSDGRLAFRVDSGQKVEYDLDNLSGADQWYDLAFTWDRSGSSVDTELFIDGVSRGSTSGTWVNPGTLFLGSGNSGNTAGNGTWDNFALFDRLLSDSEIAQIAANGSSLAVPEPSSMVFWGILGFALAGFVAARARLQKRSRPLAAARG